MRVITETDISNLKKKGFINIKNFFNKDDIVKLLSEADKIYPNTKQNTQSNSEKINNKKILGDETAQGN